MFSKDHRVSRMIPRCFWDVVCITLLLLNTSGECDIALDFQVRWCSRWYLSSTINFILFYLFDYKFVDLMIFSFLQGKICASQTFCAPYQHSALSICPSVIMLIILLSFEILVFVQNIALSTTGLTISRYMC